MIRFLFAAALLLLPVAARAQTEQQALVDRAALTVQDIMQSPNSADLVGTLRRARAVMICPRIFKLGFILGGSGGGCVLAARDGSGSWSDPAFYGIGSGSLGFQAGIQDSETMMFILTPRGLDAVMDDQFKIGADASIAIATIGAGVEGATTAATGADIVAFSQARGLFAGASIAGSLLQSRTGWNQAYYGQALAARQIVLQMQANNPGANPLRAILMRFGAPGMAPAGYAAAAPPPGYYQQGPYGQQGPAGPPPGYYGAAPPQGAPMALTPSAPVQSQSLPPPR
jgi:SH3 domain-containing YSC84-like protein 1